MYLISGTMRHTLHGVNTRKTLKIHVRRLVDEILLVWPIIRGKSYVRETGKSMKAAESAASQKGCHETLPYHAI